MLYQSSIRSVETWVLSYQAFAFECHIRTDLFSLSKTMIYEIEMNFKNGLDECRVSANMVLIETNYLFLDKTRFFLVDFHFFDHQ